MQYWPLSTTVAATILLQHSITAQFHQIPAKSQFGMVFKMTPFFPRAELWKLRPFHRYQNFLKPSHAIDKPLKNSYPKHAYDHLAPFKIQSTPWWQVMWISDFQYQWSIFSTRVANSSIIHKHASDYLQTVFIGSTYVGQTVNVEGQPLRHGEHLNRESAPLCKTINREPVECLINGATGNKSMSPYIPDKWLGIKVNCTEVIKFKNDHWLFDFGVEQYQKVL